VERLGKLINAPGEDIRKLERGNFLLGTWQLVQVAAKLNTGVMSLLIEKKRQLIALGRKNGTTESVRITRLKKELEQWEHDSPFIRLMPGSGKIADLLESIVLYTDRLQNYSTERIMPDGKAQLIIDLEHSSAVVVGPHDVPVDLPLKGKSHKIIIRFQPYGLYRLTGIPQDQLLNRVLDAQYIFGNDTLLLKETLRSCKSYDEQKTALYAFFMARLPRHDRSVVEEKVVRYLVDHIDEPIARLVKISGYSAKHLIHLFRIHTGFTPKMFQQVMQFAESIRQMSLLPTHHLSGLSLSANYVDQSHLIRQFKRFSGFTPSAYLKTGNSCPRMVLLEND
jgi:AraC-like DNA-binding protein